MGTARWTGFWLVDAFASEPFCGNPAGVILEAEGLSADTMRMIAREVGASETAFVVPPMKENANLGLRWFTPTCEVPFSGHATLATMHVLVETGRYRPPAELIVATLSGPLKIRLRPQDNNTCITMVETPTPHFEPSPIDREEVAEALLVSQESLHPDLPLRKDGMHLFVPFRRLEALLNMHPDFRCLSRLGLEHEITGFTCFTTESIDPKASWHLRFFAPGMGVSEDPVTGAAQGPMAAYLLEQGILSAPPGKACSWVGEQGDALERRGQVQVELTLDEAGHTREVFVGGTAVTVMKGQMRII